MRICISRGSGVFEDLDKKSFAWTGVTRIKRNLGMLIDQSKLKNLLIFGVSNPKASPAWFSMSPGKVV